MKRFLSLKSRDVIVVVAASMFMAQLDGAVLAVAVPRISSDFGVPVVSLSLAITIYLTMLVAMLPVSGWAADRFGARRVFLGATLGFGFSSLLCALADRHDVDVVRRDRRWPAQARVVQRLLRDRRDRAAHPDAVGPHRDPDRLAVGALGIE